MNIFGTGRATRSTGRPYSSHTSRRPRRTRFEVLEPRLVMAPVLDPIADVTVPAGASILVRLNGHVGAAGDALSFSAESVNASIAANLMPATNRSLKLMVKGFGSTPDVAQEMVVQLFENLAPLATGRFIQLASEGFFDHVNTFNGFDATTVPSVATLDGKTFLITDGNGASKTFEFVNTKVRTEPAAGRVAVNFDATSATIGNIQSAVATAISGAGLAASAAAWNDGRVFVQGANLTLNQGTSPFTTQVSSMTFHRVVKDFMIQGGDPKGDGTAGSTLNDFDDQFNPDLRFTNVGGVLAMAKSGDDTNNSQFFITGGEARHLDFNHTIFGYLTVGDDVRQAIENVEVVAQSSGGEVSKPTTPVIIESVSVIADQNNGVLLIKAPKGATGDGDVTVTLRDQDGNAVTQTFHVTIAADTTTTEPPYLNPVAEIHTSVNTAKGFTLSATDVNSAGVQFYQGITSGNNLAITVSETTGQGTVTPSNGLVGIHAILVGVRDPSSDPTNDYSYYDDTQVVPVFIHPAAPAVGLTGGSGPGGAYTNHNNTAGKKLTFRVSGLTANTEVTLYADRTYNADGTVLDEGTPLAAPLTATGATLDITTNGTATLADGNHTITAVQTLKNQEIPYGNRSGEKSDLASAPGTIQVVVSTVAPQITSSPGIEAAVGQQYAYNVVTNPSSGMTYTLPTKPAGMTVDAAGHVAWTPQPDQWPSQAVMVRVTDVFGNSAQQSFTIGVSDNSQNFDPHPVISLPADSAGNLITLRKNGDRIWLVNDRSGLLLFAQPLNRTLSMTLEGGSQADQVTVNFAAGGVFNLTEGLFFEGGTGSDTLVVHGGTGADTLAVNDDAVAANNLQITPTEIERIRLEGDQGANRYMLTSSTVPVAVVDGGGADTLDFSAAAGGVRVSLALAGGQAQTIAPWGTAVTLTGMIENVTGSNFADTLIGNAGRNILRGLDGNDILRCRGGNDALLGGDGNDRVFADAGNCLLIGGRGADSLYGGIGNDTLIGGTTSYDNNDQALLSLLSQGAMRNMFSFSPNRFQSAGTNSLLQLGTTVQDDGARNSLFGNGGHDWYLAGRQDAWR